MNQEKNSLSQPPPPLAARSIQLPTPHEIVLPNGLTVVVVEDTRLPLVSVRLALRTGDAHDPEELPGLMDMLTGLLTEGTKSRTSREIADEVARLGATLQAGANSDYSTVAASSLTNFFAEILELLADVTLRPVFPESEVELTKQNTKESLKQQRAQPTFLASEMVARVMFGQHPYHVTAPTPESVDSTSRQALVDFHRRTFVANNAVLIITGDIKLDATTKRVDDLFGGWQPGISTADNFPTPPARSKRSAYVVDRPGSAQSNIIIANSGITRTSEDYFPMLVMHTILGANASSRLFMNLREEKGYTYGAYSSLDARRTAGTFRANAEVRTPVTGDSLKEFFYELNRIRSEPVSEKELADAKSYLTGVFPIRLETQEGLIDQLVQIKMFGLPEDYLENYRNHVQEVTLERVKEVAQKYVKPDEAAIIIVGDGAQLNEQIASYASEIEYFNTAGKRKDAPKAFSAAAAQRFIGDWQLTIQSPLGQDIPATLALTTNDSSISGQISSEMGNGEVRSLALDGDAFAGTVTFDVAGQTMNAQIEGRFAGSELEGNLNLEGAPSLPFTGRRNQ